MHIPGFDFVKRVYAEANRDDVFDGAAALAFYLTLAIFPAMIFLMAVIPYLPIARVDQAILDLLHQALPPSAADMFSRVIRQVTSERRTGLLSLGLAVGLWSASTGMYAVMRQLNVVFNVAERRRFLKARGTALGLTLLFFVLVLGALSLVVLGGVIQDWIGARWGFSGRLLTTFAVLRWIVIVAGMMAGVSLIYHLAPNRRQSFRWMSAGAGASALMLVVASYGFSLYTANSGSYSAVYGSIGAVILLMLWLYIAGLAILVGAEVNVVIERSKAGDAEAGIKQKPDPLLERHHTAI